MFKRRKVFVVTHDEIFLALVMVSKLDPDKYEKNGPKALIARANDLRTGNYNYFRVID